jgi:hypothetical protein
MDFHKKCQKTCRFFQLFLPCDMKNTKILILLLNVQRNQLFLKPNALIKFTKLLRGRTFFPNGRIFVPDWPESAETLLCGCTTEKI